jgi:predicted transcriptional regulator
MRTLIDLPDSQIRALADLCEATRQPRTALIRDAVAEYLARRTRQPDTAAFGLWGPAAADGVAYQDSIRAEW